jgi:hypothetical protein
MDGCTLLTLISKRGFIPKGAIYTPLDRVRTCIRKKYLSENKIIYNSVESTNQWNFLHRILNQVYIYPLNK